MPAPGTSCAVTSCRTCHCCPSREFIPAASRAVALQAGLAFLGVGDPTEPSWGAMIRDAVAFRAVFVTSACTWWLVPPIVALVGLIVGITLLGTALERRSSPRLARHQR